MALTARCFLQTVAGTRRPRQQNVSAIAEKYFSAETRKRKAEHLHKQNHLFLLFSVCRLPSHHSSPITESSVTFLLFRSVSVDPFVDEECVSVCVFVGLFDPDMAAMLIKGAVQGEDLFISVATVFRNISEGWVLNTTSKIELSQHKLNRILSVPVCSCDFSLIFLE